MSSLKSWRQTCTQCSQRKSQHINAKYQDKLMGCRLVNQVLLRLCCVANPGKNDTLVPCWRVWRGHSLWSEPSPWWRCAWCPRPSRRPWLEPPSLQGSLDGEHRRDCWSHNSKPNWADRVTIGAENTVWTAHAELHAGLTCSLGIGRVRRNFLVRILLPKELATVAIGTEHTVNKSSRTKALVPAPDIQTDSTQVRRAVVHVVINILHLYIIMAFTFIINNSIMKALQTCVSQIKKPRRRPYLKRYLAQTMQWMGSDGVFLMVQPGKVFWVGLGWHS